MTKNYFNVLENYGFIEGEPSPKAEDGIDLDSLARDLKEVQYDPNQPDHTRDVVGFVPRFFESEKTFSKLGWYFDKLAIQDPIMGLLSSQITPEFKISQIHLQLSYLFPFRRVIETGNLVFLPRTPGIKGSELGRIARENLENPEISEFYANTFYNYEIPPEESLVSVNGNNVTQSRSSRIGVVDHQALQRLLESGLPLNVLELNDDIDLESEAKKYKFYNDPGLDQDMKFLLKSSHLFLEREYLSTLTKAHSYGLPIATLDPAFEAQIRWRGQNNKLKVLGHSDIMALKDLMLPYLSNLKIDHIVELKFQHSESLKQLRSSLLKIVDRIRDIDQEQDLEYELELLRKKEIDPRIEEVKAGFKATNDIWRLKSYGLPITMATVGFIGLYCFGEPISYAFLGGGITDAFHTFWHSRKEKMEIQSNPFFYLWQLTG